MRFSNPGFKKKFFNFQFFEVVPKKFSSLNLLFLLFGFFLGNLSPQGLFFQSVPCLFPLAQEDFVKKERSEVKESREMDYETSSVAVKSDRNSEQGILAKKNPRKIDNQLNRLSETNTIWSLIGIFNAFPGPAPTILVWSEIFNWLSFRLFSFQNPYENNFTLSFFQKIFQKRSKKNGFFDSVTKARNKDFRAEPPFLDHQTDKMGNEKNQGFYGSNLHFFLRSFNSIKIGFLLGIFVDAFKVGS